MQNPIYLAVKFEFLKEHLHHIKNPFFNAILPLQVLEGT